MILGLRTSPGVSIAAGAVLAVQGEPVVRSVAVTRVRAAVWCRSFFQLRSLFSLLPVEAKGVDQFEAPVSVTGDMVHDHIEMSGSVACDTLDFLDDQFIVRVPAGGRLGAHVENIDGAPHRFYLTALADPCCNVCEDCKQFPEIGRRCQLRKIEAQVSA